MNTNKTMKYKENNVKMIKNYTVKYLYAEDLNGMMASTPGGRVLPEKWGGGWGVAHFLHPYPIYDQIKN